MATPGSYARARMILGVAVALLMGLLVALIVVFYGLLQPKGLPDEGDVDNTTKGLTWVRSMYGFGPSAEEQLLTPTSVAIAPNGDVYATDPIRARIMIFRPDGTFKRLLHTGAGGMGPGQFMRPESLDIDQDGNIYIADSWAKKVIVFDRTMKFVREFPVDQQARGVSVVGDRVYVLDIGHTIVFDTKGKRLAAWGQRGPAPGQLDAYQGITADEGIVYIADSFNKRLQAFAESGTPEWTVPGGVAGRGGPEAREAAGKDESASSKDPDHRWDLPQDLVFDGAGRLVVVDAFTFELTAVDPETGKAQGSWGEYGRADGQFFYPSSVDYDPRRDWFAVADTQNNRVQIVRIPGTGSGGASAFWRALSSPYRYLAIPLALIVIALVLALWTARNVSTQVEDGTESAEESV